VYAKFKIDTPLLWLLNIKVKYKKRSIFLILLMYDVFPQNYDVTTRHLF